MRSLGASLVSVCALAGCAGADFLVRVDEESPGANCPDGGSVIYTGPDDNGDGILQDEEVTSTPVYVCNGLNGDDGLDGLDGQDGQDGQDGGGGGLDFGTLIEGNYTIDNTVDAALLAGVETITGDLTINNGVTNLDVPDLIEVYGTIYIVDNTTLESVSFGSLTSAYGLDVEYSELLVDLGGFSSLTTVTNLYLDSNYVLESADLPGLAVLEYTTISNNPSLLSIAIDPVGSVDSYDFVVSYNDSLDMCIAESLLADLETEGYLGTSTLEGGVACR